MHAHLSRRALLVGIAASLAPLSTASAQFYTGGGTPSYGGYNPCATCTQQVAVAPTACYQTVPVTEYQQVERTVQRPVYETKYVEQPVTEYRPVVEQRTVEVPQTVYQDVVECQTVTRDMSYWQTSYQPVPKMNPCEYDGRPDVFGWLNRTAYSIRKSFTPNYVAQRHYVPNVVAQTVPVTRRVAHRTTRQMTYNVTRMEPHTTTRKVAVRTVRYVAEKETVNVPVTVMRTVPIGATATALLPGTTSSTATAVGPTPDPIGSRSAENTDGEEREARRFQRSDADELEGRNGAVERRAPVRNASFTTRRPGSSVEAARTPQRRSRENTSPRAAPTVRNSRGITPAPGPSIVKVARWTAHRPQQDRRPAPAPANGPSLIGPVVSTTP